MHIRKFAHCIIFIVKRELYIHRMISISGIGERYFISSETAEEFSNLTGYLATGIKGHQNWGCVSHDIILEMLGKGDVSIQTMGLSDRIGIPSGVDFPELTLKSLDNLLQKHFISTNRILSFPLDNRRRFVNDFIAAP